MRREILAFRFGRNISGCCPGHDTYPADTYNSRLSKRARSRGKQKEHKLVRTLRKRELLTEISLHTLEP